MASHEAQILAWYQKAQIDYVQKYMALYASFNAWYRQSTGATNDRQALNQLRLGNELWQEYCEGQSLRAMGSLMRSLVELTQRSPVSYATPHWRGEVSNVKDWPSLLEYWYRVRCLVMHGSEINFQYVHLAYETLNAFMSEIIRRERY